MHYDLIIIGTGLSGLMSAKTASDLGKRVLLVGKGMGSLTLFSNSIDILGEISDSIDLKDGLSKWIDEHPFHPYSKVGLNGVFEGISSFLSVFKSNYPFKIVGNRNVFIPTCGGTKRPTFMIPETMISGISSLEEKTLIVGFEGFRDFSANYIARQNKWRGITIKIPEAKSHEISSIYISRLMERESFRETIAMEVKKNLKNESHIGFPAILGLHDPVKVKTDLEKRIGTYVFEIPTLPPSIPGLRIYNRFKEWLINKGVTIISGYQVSNVSLNKGRCEGIFIQDKKISDFYSADNFILATGRFMGGGLIATRERIIEPIFDLPLIQPATPEEWFEKSFFDKHPVHMAGISTDSSLRPLWSKGGFALENLWVAGTILSGHNFFYEKSKEGIEIATGYCAAKCAIMQ